jgi:hypothetical protein
MIRILSAHGYAGYLSNENLSGVALPGATGFVGETLSQATTQTTEPIEAKLRDDLQYLKGLER